MDPELQAPLKKLAEALHQAIARSPEVEHALADVKAHGFQAFLVLEVTVALSRLGIDGEAAEDAAPELASSTTSSALEKAGQTALEPLGRSEDGTGVTGRLDLRVSADDREFLKSIRISLD